MKNSDKKSLLKWNTILWLAAMVLPAIFSIAFASTKFPWPMIFPLLLLGPMLLSNKMLAQGNRGVRRCTKSEMNENPTMPFTGAGFLSSVIMLRTFSIPTVTVSRRPSRAGSTAKLHRAAKLGHPKKLRGRVS